ncbi:MAG: hypothetical protein AAF412_02320 [Pseudomonadota bacterium]
MQKYQLNAPEGTLHSSIIASDVCDTNVLFDQQYARFLARGGEFVPVGTEQSRLDHVVIEFDSLRKNAKASLACQQGKLELERKH